MTYRLLLFAAKILVIPAGLIALGLLVAAIIVLIAPRSVASSQMDLQHSPEAAGAGPPATARPSLANHTVGPLIHRKEVHPGNGRSELSPVSVVSPAAPAGTGVAGAPCASPCAVDVAEWDIPTPEPVAVVRTGLASTYGSGWSERWVALPEGPGWRFRVCPLGHAGICRALVSTDAGPSKAMQRKGRVVDLPVGAFRDVCGGDWRILGLCRVTIQILGRVRR